MSLEVTQARRAAFDTLWRVQSEGAYATNLLASNRYGSLSRQDHALLQEMTLGVLRWQGKLDFLIEHYARRSLSKLDPEVIIALRLGLYQLRFLTRIPPHAAINESVNLVKERKQQSAAPLVNAVLRAAQRDDDPIPLIKDPLQRLSIETSHPRWLLERWIDRFGEEETRALALANNTPPRTAFRFVTSRAPETETRQWFNDRSITISDSEYALRAATIETGSLTAQSEPIREGWIYLQDEASQLVAHLAAARPSGTDFKSQISNLKFLDLCAAPGSKTMLIASLLPESSLIVAADLHLHRLRLMKELSAKHGIERINLVQLDATGDLPFALEASFDLVLLDAPCSGLGTLQRHPEIKWRMSIERIRELARLQRDLIENAQRQVRAGGLLTYAVCSTEPEEGEEVVEWFRRTHPEYRDVTRERLFELGIDPAPLLTSSFGARTFPHRQGIEGFFVCVFWRRR
jgi:16S rRNA (cytosine967-C5)-methyltransferase